MENFSFLLRNLPADLEALAERVSFLATDLRWTWSHAGDALWEKIDSDTWEQTKNPFVVLQNLTLVRLKALAKDDHFMDQLQHLAVAHEEYSSQSGWYGETYKKAQLKNIAYFSMEFGLGEALPLYAGGLGILAGDYLKGASDLGVPVTGIGLLYQEGYFRQTLNEQGWQQEIYPYNEPTSMPVFPVRSKTGAWLSVQVYLPGRVVHLRVWRAQVGRVTLYLLDSNDPLNSPIDRGITGKLYGGGQEMRLMQEIVLGIGGWRVIESQGLAIDVCHLNEGHAAFVTLERARSFMEQNKVEFKEALWATRAGNVFTTHTPVTAGFDVFTPELLMKYGRAYADKLGIDPHELGAMGRKNSDNHNEPFNMAYLAMRTCGLVNGVSELHGKVSRRIFQDLYPRWPQDEVPVTHITNGVHVPSWDSLWADKAWTRAAGKERWRGCPEGLPIAILENINDEELWGLRGKERADLVGYARRRLAKQLGQRGTDSATVSQADTVLDPNVLTLGFARRFTEYKRPNLILHDPQRLIRLLTNPERPVQIIIAGKAHPHDRQGKRFIQKWMHFIQQPEVRAHVVFLEDYDIAMAQELVKGVDVWLNNPRRPWEACGTSGMKVLVNGGLNLSELDGWWAEAYTPEVGWALGDGKEHPEPGWDAVEANELYQRLEEEVVPTFYDRDATGIPRAWVTRMRASMADLAPQFSTNRMVQEYVEKMYLPAANAFQHRISKGADLVKGLPQWDERLRQHWHELHWGNLIVSEEKDGWTFEVQIYLGELSPESVQVQLYADSQDAESPACDMMQRYNTIPGSLNGYIYRGSVTTTSPHNDFTPRVVAYHPDAYTPIENNLIMWWIGEKELQTK